MPCCEELGIQFISDEIYHGLTYPEETGIAEVSALQFSDKAIIINSFSKYFCMDRLAGWLDGFATGTDSTRRTGSARAFIFQRPNCRRSLRFMRLIVARNWKLFGWAIWQTGDCCWIAYRPWVLMKCCPLTERFTPMPMQTRFTNDTMEFAERMLVESHVAVTPGLDFDRDRGHRYLRFSFAGDHETMIKAMDSLEDWLA